MKNDSLESLMGKGFALTKVSLGEEKIWSFGFVELRRIELPTSSLRTTRSGQLSYNPDSIMQVDVEIVCP